jgi:hypothetical protein
MVRLPREILQSVIQNGPSKIEKDTSPSRSRYRLKAASFEWGAIGPIKFQCVVAFEKRGYRGSRENDYKHVNSIGMENLDWFNLFYCWPRKSKAWWFLMSRCTGVHGATICAMSLSNAAPIQKASEASEGRQKAV